MFRLIYLSSAVDRITQPLIDGIISHANLRNAERGIIGVLIHNGRNFMQVLEGDRDAVERLYGTILGDTRHEHVTTLLEETGVDRAFPEWTMRPLDLATEIGERRTLLQPSLSPILSERARTLILSITTFG